MGLSKSEKFKTEQNEMAILAKALAHPARIAILEHLIEINACVCGDLVLELPLSQATVSQHLKSLKDAQIIEGNISGTSVCYCINPKTWKIMENKFKTFFESMKENSNCC